MVEDNKADVYLIREAISGADLNADLEIVSDGEQAIRFFNTADRDDSIPCPSLVLLDINLPKRNGSEVLEHMRNSRRCAQAMVVVVTSSDSDDDREQMARLGADEYFHKPSEYREFMKLGDLIKRLLDGVS